MASILPIIGTVAGSMIGGPVGGAIGGGLGSLAGSYATKGKLETSDIAPAALSAGLGYVGGGGFGGAGDAVAGGAGDVAAKGAVDASIGSAAAGAGAGGAAALEGAAAGAGAGTGTLAATTAAPSVIGAGVPDAVSGAALHGTTTLPQVATAGAGSGITGSAGLASAAPTGAALHGLPVGAAASPAAAAAKTPTPWLGREGMYGLTRGQMIGYGGLAALPMLMPSTPSTPDLPTHPAPVLSTTPTNRRFTTPPTGYRPGFDPEWRYFQAARGGLVPHFYDGGEVEGGKGDGGKGGATSEGGGYQGGGGDKGGGSFGGSIDAGSGGSSIGSGPGPTGGGDPWGAGISNTGYSGGLDAGPGSGMGGAVGGGENAGLSALTLGGAPVGIGGLAAAAAAPKPPQRTLVMPGAGYRPGMDPEHTYFKDVPAPVAPDNTAQDHLQQHLARGGRVRGYAGGGTLNDLQKMGMFGLVGLGAANWHSDDDAPAPAPSPGPQLATQPQDRRVIGAPANYQPGRDPEHTFFQNMASGGIADAAPRLLQGDGDGLSDSIRGSIDGREPVDLSSGEFVVPARVVSGLGNGSTEAGARKLQRMMQRIRAAQSKMGNRDQPIDESSVLPA